MEDEDLVGLNSELQEKMVDPEDDEVMEVEDGHTPQRDATMAKSTEDDESQRRAATVIRSTEEREPKRHKKINLEGLMERYINMRAKQAEDEAVVLAKEKEDALLAKEKQESEGNDVSIKKCISLVNTLEITKEEKAKSFKLFKDLANREIFLSAHANDPEVALIWLRDEIA